MLTMILQGQTVRWRGHDRMIFWWCWSTFQSKMNKVWLTALHALTS